MFISDHITTPIIINNFRCAICYEYEYDVHDVI